MKRAIVLLSAAVLGGCLSSGAREPDRYFILEAPARTQAAAAVRVAPTSASSFYDTQDIVFSRAAGTRAYYQFSHWTQPPQQAIHAQLASRLEAGSPASGLVLRTQLREIYHDAAQQPGTARIAMTAQLVDSSGKVIARKAFSRSAPAASHDAPGAVAGLRDALGALLDDVVAWVDAEVPPKAR